MAEHGISEWRLTPTDHTEWNDKVRRLAQRLGVAPYKSASPPSFAVTLAAGDERYDVIDLVNAFLDQLDNKTPG